MAKPHKNKRVRSWSRYELEKLVVLVAFCQHECVDFDEVARHLWNRSPSEAKKRWNCVRDHMCRKWRQSLHKASESSDPSAPYQGELHWSLKWVETQWGDIEAMRL